MGRETKGRGRQTVTLPPPPLPPRRVPCRITSKGEGGWAPQGTCSPGRWPPGRGASGGHGGSGASGGHGGSGIWPPPKKSFLAARRPGNTQ